MIYRLPVRLLTFFLSINIIFNSCSQSQQSQDQQILENLTLDLDSSEQNQGIEEENLAIYIGDLLINGKTLKSTLTLIDPNEYTLEQIEVEKSETVSLYASTGTYTIEEKKPLEGISQDMITLKPDDSEYPNISLTFLEDDSLSLLDSNSVTTSYILKKQKSKLDSSY